MKRFLIILFSIFILASCMEGLISPSDLIEDVPVIDIVIGSDEYQTLLSNKLVNVDVPCIIYYGKDRFKGYIRSVGAGSRYEDKWSYRLKINEGCILGLRQFNLSAQVADESMIVANIAVGLYEKYGFPVPESFHVFLRINGSDKGLYFMIERVDIDFFRKRNIESGELFKVGFGSKFSFEKDNLPHSTIDKKIPDDKDYLSLINLFYAVDTSNSSTIYQSLGQFLDIENYIKYHALTSILNNEDAYTNNFHFHKPDFESPFDIIPWDFDKCFDGNPYSSLSGRNEIMEKLLRSDTTRRRYIAVVKEVLENSFRDEDVFPIIDSVAGVIRESYDLDPYLGNGRFDLDEQIKKVKDHIIMRRQYYIENIDSIKAE